jgi:hypothetical protein
MGMALGYRLGSSKAALSTLRQSLLRVSLALVGLALLTSLTGCATPKPNAEQKENLLKASGFRAIQATTPGQRQTLNLMPAGRVSVARRNGHIYFVYPIRERNVVYVGNNPQYVAYAQLAHEPSEQAMITEELQDIQRFPSASFRETPWSEWDSP